MRKLRDFLPATIYERAVRTTPLTRKTKVAAACTVLALTYAGHAVAAPAKSSQAAAEAIEKALQRHGGDVHRCFEKVLADRLDSAGMVEVSVDVGQGGKVTAAKVKKSAGTPPALAACVEKAALTWTIEGIEAGAAVVLPFSFKAQANQYVVNGSDVPERALGGQAQQGKKVKPGPKRDAPFTVKVLADETNVKAAGISLTQLNVGPASRVAMHRHAHSAKILYLVKGHARLLGPEGVAPLKLDEGSAVFVPAGYPHVIENMGRQSTAVFLQAFSPPGPERVYRNPADATGRAEFEVIRDPSQAKAPPESDGKVVFASAAEAKAEPLAKVGTVKNLIQVGGPRPMTLSLLELSDGAEVQGKGDAAATEVLYFVVGGGSVRIGGEAAALAPEAMVYVPRGTSYSLKAAAGEKSDKVLVVQFKVPTSGKPRAAAPKK